jgi:hypothetical protein
MRLSIYAAATVAVIAGATSLAPRAEAFTAPAFPQVQSTAEEVAYRTVCSRVWDGYGYVRQCRQVWYEPAPRYVAPPRYYSPPPRYYGGGGGYGY